MTISKSVVIAICSTLVIGFGATNAQQAKKADVLLSVKVKNTTANNVEVFVADWNQGKGNLARKLGPNEEHSTKEKALAKIARPTSTDPETNLHWRAVTNLDEKGIPLKPDDKKTKRLLWCGQTNTYKDDQTVEVKDTGGRGTCR